MEEKKLILTPNVFVYGQTEKEGETFIFAPNTNAKKYLGEKRLWVHDPIEDKTTLYTGDGFFYAVSKKKKQTEITFFGECSKTEYASFPSCDFLGNAFDFCIEGDSGFTKTLACLYWKNLLPQVAETSRICKKNDWQRGYVISTLDTSVYAGTYPAVDHEFHIKGRAAMGGAFDMQVVKRMIELTLKTMEKDGSGKYRVPCSVQPNRKREYYITRYSIDKTVKAIMFPLTGLIEVIESIYTYFCYSKDIEFVKICLPTVEKGMGYFYEFMSKNGRLNANVYYEDQVMKDGATAQAQAFAVRSMSMLSFLEELVGNKDKSYFYSKLGSELRQNYVKDLPEGYWNGERYVDFINKDGSVHDHVHLLSNALSVLLGFNEASRDEKIKKLIAGYEEELQRFPTFLSPRVEDYTPSEIGSGGPYDLAAAGRYWEWDARYKAFLNDGKALLKQLYAVRQAAEAEEYYLGERYDMNHVYYNKGKFAERLWHGAAKYYEYPCVFADVLVGLVFGVNFDKEGDISVKPLLKNASFLMESKGIYYKVDEKSFCIKNISPNRKTVLLDLSAIAKQEAQTIALEAGESKTIELL